jgi:hypothetical protein
VGDGDEDTRRVVAETSSSRFENRPSIMQMKTPSTQEASTALTW